MPRNGLGVESMRNRKTKLRSVMVLLTNAILITAVLTGLILLLTNFYGLTQSIRKPGLGVIDHEELRFIPREVWSYEQSLKAIEKLSDQTSAKHLVSEANRVVNSSLIHIDWLKVNPLEYRQLVPFWENYFLWAIGKFSGLPQFERYHYADYRRNIRRGIGICGDASTVLSSVLDNYGIENRIVSFKGHVIVEYEDEYGAWFLADPDFGVEMGGDLQQLVQDPERFRQYYLDAGYATAEVDYLFEAYDSTFAIFDNTYHFMTKRYIFEKVSYVVKWLLPIILLLFSGLYVLRKRKGNDGAIKP